jgi:hypothetical protein
MLADTLAIHKQNRRGAKTKNCQRENTSELSELGELGELGEKDKNFRNRGENQKTRTGPP